MDTIYQMSLLVEIHKIDILNLGFHYEITC